MHNMEGSEDLVISQMMEVPLGTGANERLGKKIVVTNIYVKGKLETSPQKPHSDIARIIIVQDRQTNGGNMGVPFAGTDLLLNPAGLQDNERSFRNLANNDSGYIAVWLLWTCF